MSKNDSEETPVRRSRRVRTRSSRVINTEPTVEDDISEELTVIEELMATTYTENLQKNKHDKANKKARSTLLASMKDANINNHKCSVVIDGSTKMLEAIVATPDSTEINVIKLKKLVGDDVFMKIISATKKAIIAQAGEVIYNQCTKSVLGGGTENVSVGAAK